jgi:hypothetical protein
MLIIKRKPYIDGKFIVTLSPGLGVKSWSVEAESLAEAQETLSHYYGSGNGGHAHLAECPICRKLAVERETQERAEARQAKRLAKMNAL